MSSLFHVEKFLADETATQAFGAQLAQLVNRQKQTVFHFQGEIGAGKTTLIRSLLRNLGVDGPIKSPTFSIVEPYLVNDFPIYHFDLYRLVDPMELEYLGWRDCFSTPSLCCFEWPERAQAYLPSPDLWIHLKALANGRELRVESSRTE